MKTKNTVKVNAVDTEKQLADLRAKALELKKQMDTAKEDAKVRRKVIAAKVADLKKVANDKLVAAKTARKEAIAKRKELKQTVKAMRKARNAEVATVRATHNKAIREFVSKNKLAPVKRVKKVAVEAVAVSTEVSATPVVAVEVPATV